MSLLLISIFFLIQFFLTAYSNEKNSNRIFEKDGSPAASPLLLILLSMAGILVLWIAPFVLFDFPVVEKVFSMADTKLLLLYLVYLTLLASFSYFSVSKSISPFTNNKNLETFLLIFFLFRTLFIVAYEIFFRGYVLMVCSIEWGWMTALCISTALTVLIHLFNGIKEMTGTLIFGILQGLFVLITGNIWFAVVAHLVVAITHETRQVLLSKRNLT